MRGIGPIVEVAHSISFLDERKDDFVPEAEIQCQVRRDLPVILNERGFIPATQVDLEAAAPGVLACKAEHEIGHAVFCETPVELVGTADLVTDIENVVLRPQDVATEL